MKKLLLFASIAVVGCSSGGGGGGGSSQSTTPAVNQPPDGIWHGTVSRAGEVINDVSCLITDESQLACILLIPDDSLIAGVADGTITTTGSTPSGSGTVYTAPCCTLADGSSRDDFTIESGGVESRSALRASIDVAGSIDTINATYDDSYERGSSLSTVEGVYSQASIQGSDSSFSVDLDGSIFAQAGDCTYNGAISAPDPEVNMYEITLEASGCPGREGTYSGLGITEDFSATDDSLIFVAFIEGDTWLFGQALK